MTVSAPYNFVPLSDLVCSAEDLQLSVPPSQDTPEPDAQSGAITFTITCETPILVNWSEKKKDKGQTPETTKKGDKAESNRIKAFGRTPDGKLAIPGSTLRGMIRNVLEIATFGKMSIVDDARTSVRDLNPTARLDYGSRVSATFNGAYRPIPQAGWLSLQGSNLRLEPCQFARIDHEDLWKKPDDFHAATKICISNFRKNKKIVKNDMACAENVEDLYLTKASAKNVRLWVQTEVDRHVHSKSKVLVYRRAARTQQNAERRTPNEPIGVKKKVAVDLIGDLVFTGMPSDRKHMEFFFFDRDPANAKIVDPKIWARFLDVHERQEKISPTWAWRKKELYAGNCIPIFYLVDDSTGDVSHLGLAMMFKLPADNSIGEMIDNSSIDHRNSAVVDLAERIFGRLESERSKVNGWRGRVSFGWAEITSAYEEVRSEPVVLAKPKPGFPAGYVRQTDFESVGGAKLLNDEIIGGNGKSKSIRAQYRSYMNWSSDVRTDPVKEKIRGWKRYPVGPERGLGLAPGEGESVSILKPLCPNNGQPITFTFTLRYHNLAPVELGALIWAATWGGDPNLRHAVGMGRPLGWGQVNLTASLNASQVEAMTKFQAEMENWAKRNGMAAGWLKSRQIKQLCAMADPAVGKAVGTLLDQMRIQVGVAQGNDFANAKEAGAVLPEYGRNDISDDWAGPDPARLKVAADSDQDLLVAIRKRAEDVRYGISAKRQEAAKSMSRLMKYQRGDKVQINTTTVRAEGDVVKDTGADGKTEVRFFLTAADKKKGRPSQDRFTGDQLKPLGPKE